MKTVALIVLLSCCAFGQDKAAKSAVEDAACGPRDMDFEVKIDASAHPTPIPESGKAMIYVVQVSRGFTTRFAIDGNWVGALNFGTYLTASIEPGEHHLCAMGPHFLGNFVSLHGLKTEAGMTYYFTVRLLHGESYRDYHLSPADTDEGKYLVGGARLSISRRK